MNLKVSRAEKGELDNDDDEYDDFDDDASDIYSRFVSEQRLLEMRARVRACHRRTRIAFYETYGLAKLEGCMSTA